jgi:hypothetical protein
MAHRFDDDGRARIQGGTARIPAPGEPGGGPVVLDDTPPELKEHLKREQYKDDIFEPTKFLVEAYEKNYPKIAEERRTMTLAEAEGFRNRRMKAFDADVRAMAEAAPSDEARRRFSEAAVDLCGAFDTLTGTTERTFKDTRQRSDLELQAAALSRQAQAYPEDYALHAAVLDKVADGAAPLVTRERAIQFRAVEAEKMARSAMMGFIEQGRFDEGRALLATATDADGTPGTLPLTPEAVKELGGMLEQRHADAAAREVRLDRVDTVIEGTAGPTDDAAEWQALVEEHYQVAGPQMAELEPAERIGAEDDYVRKLGHLPKPLTRSLRAGMLSDEPEHEAAAALRLKTLADHDPALIAAIPETERARAAAIAEFAELGLKPERAVELGEKKLAAQNMFQTTEPGEDGGADDVSGGVGDKRPADDGKGDKYPAGGAPKDGDDAGKEKESDFTPKPSLEEQERLKELTKRLEGMSKEEQAQELRRRGITNADEMAEQGIETVTDIIQRLDGEDKSEKITSASSEVKDQGKGQESVAAGSEEKPDPASRELEKDIQSLFDTKDEGTLNKILDKIRDRVSDPKRRQELEEIAKKSAEGKLNLPLEYRSTDSLKKEEGQLEAAGITGTLSKVSKQLAEPKSGTSAPKAKSKGKAKQRRRKGSPAAPEGGDGSTFRDIVDNLLDAMGDRDGVGRAAHGAAEERYRDIQEELKRRQ